MVLQLTALVVRGDGQVSPIATEVLVGPEPDGFAVLTSLQLSLWDGDRAGEAGKYKCHDGREDEGLGVHVRSAELWKANVENECNFGEDGRSC